jgi:TRAP-type C4-dicarboxylate transport system permease small subunit
MPDSLQHVYNRLIQAGAAVSGAVFVFMMLVVSLDSVLRYVFNSPLGWVVEVNEYLLLYVTFLGAPWLLRQDGHVRVDLLFAYIPERVARRLTMWTSVLGAAACLVLCAAGCQATWEAFVRELPEIKTLAVPRWMLLWVIPYGSLLLSVEFCIKAWGHWRETAPAPTRATE